MRKVTVAIETWELKVPLVTAAHTVDKARVVYVTLSENGVMGRGEAHGIYYFNETAESIAAQIEGIREKLEQGIDREGLQELMPRGGARNAVDCVLWDLEAKLSGNTIWELTGVEPAEVITVVTVGIGTPEEMAATAVHYDTPIIKVKLDGEIPLARMQAIRAVQPEAELIVDVNQGWSFEELLELAPQFKALGVTMIEQPLPRGGDEALEGYASPVPLCADESCLDSSELEQAARRYDMVNIKLDKTGGLTEALKLANRAKAMGLKLMVGNMEGTSLAMAPGFVVAQLCEFVDLDGGILLKQDRDNAMAYSKGVLAAPSSALWG